MAPRVLLGPLALLLLSSPLAPAAVGPGCVDDCLLNGGFEAHPLPHGTPFAWTENGHTTVSSADAGAWPEVRSGLSSARLELAPQTTIWLRSTPVPVLPGELVEGEAWFHGNGADSAVLRLRFDGLDGVLLGQTSATYVPSGETWTSGTVAAVAPAGTLRVVFDVGMERTSASGTGVAYADDASLRVA